MGKVSSSRKTVKSTDAQQTNAEAMLRVTVFIPFLDSILYQLKNRFTEHHKKSISGGCLLPKMSSQERNAEALKSFDENYLFYKKVLPPSSLEQARGEYDVWRAFWSQRTSEAMPEDAISTLEKCDRNALPIIHSMLRILAIQPVSTASAERTFSCLRRLKTWLRNMMSEKRLSGLALMALNKDKVGPNDVDELLDIFATQKARRLKLMV